MSECVVCKEYICCNEGHCKCVPCDQIESLKLQVGAMREALEAIHDICGVDGAGPVLVSVRSIAKRGLKKSEA